MTNKEAKEKLYMEWQKFLEDNIDYAGISEAYKMAFKALDQESCKDAISRQAQADGEYISKEKAIIQLSWDLSEVELPRIKESLDKLPSAAIPNNVGHWIEHPETETSAPEYLMFYECSECGDKQCFCKSDIYKKHFCNNCGAKMVKEQESEVCNG